MSKKVFRASAAPITGSFSENLQKVPEQAGRKGPGMIKLEDPTERRRREAYEEGFQRGLTEGREVGEQEGFRQMVQLQSERVGQEIEAFRSDLQAALQDVEAAASEWISQAEEILAGLALKIAEQILADQVRHPEAALPLARQALSEIQLVETVKLRVHPFHAESVRAHAEELLRAAQGLERIEIVEDPTLTGGCIVESDLGRIDATVQTQLRQIAEEFMGPGQPEQSILREAA